MNRIPKPSPPSFPPLSCSRKFHTVTIQAQGAQKPVRADIFLSAGALPLSRSAVQKLIAEGRITRNGKPLRNSDRIDPLDVCVCEIPFPNSPEGLEPESIPLEILYEDPHLLAVNKPAGLSMHPGAGQSGHTLVNALLYYTQNLAKAGGTDRPGLVHRLDKDTSGIVLVAKSDRIHSLLAAQFAQRTVKKEYWALTWGTWDSSAPVVEAPIGRSRKDRKKMAVLAEGRTARTDFQVQTDFGFCSEILAKPHTGRTHQIRVHLAHIGHPVCGDKEYGSARNRPGAFSPVFRETVSRLLSICQRQMLHAQAIHFAHPVTGKPISLEAPFPPDICGIRQFLDSLKEK